MDLTRATWRTSSYSGNNGGNCVEVTAARKIAIRDSKDPHGPVLAFAPKDWQRFADQIKAVA
jgi:Domain of unknown function (DUF397)